MTDQRTATPPGADEARAPGTRAPEPATDRARGDAAPALAAEHADAFRVIADLRRRARRRLLVVSGGLAVLLVGVMAVRVLLGDYTVTIADFVRILRGTVIPGASYIVLEVKLPRAVAGALAGFALGASGALFRRTLRNPLASPDILGVTTGAAAAAVLVLTLLGWRGAPMAIAALVGALAATALILGFARVGRGGGGAAGAIGGQRVIVAGIAIGALGQAVVSGALTLLSTFDLQTAMIWTAGSLNGVTWARIAWLAAALVVLVPLAAWLHRALAPADLGEDLAHGLGAPAGRAGLAALIVGALLAAAATAAVGPLAFVALLSTPIARSLAGGRASVGIAGLIGGVVVVLADFVGGELIFDTPLPAGVLTGAVGAPLMLWLLVSAARKG